MKRDEREVIVVDRGEHSPLWWLLVGAAVGAGLGLLFAPKSGEETRRELGKRLAKLRDAADDALGGLRAGLEGEEEEAVHRSLSEEDEALPLDEEEAEEEPPARGGARRTSGAEVSPARLELEQRLAEARARRRRALAAEEDEEPVA